MENAQIALKLEEVADILESQGANFFRILAYRRAANLLRDLKKPVHEIIETEGLAGLEKLEGIGPTLSRAIYQLSTTGSLAMLDRLRGEIDPVMLLATVPGIGRLTAERLYEDLGISTLEELEAAAYDGRLAQIEGFGTKRITGIRDSLSSRLGRIRRQGAADVWDEPSISEILQVDEEYRTKASKDQLPKIAPKRFNPHRQAWLPIFHTTRGNRHYTVLFSNTARAHQFGKTRDWVILYYHTGSAEGQCTVVTAHAGAMKGKRIVRGREEECEQYYETEGELLEVSS
jgi:hypothetical protein